MRLARPLTLTLALSLSIVACGGEGSDPTPTPTAASTPTEAQILDLRFEIPAPPEGGIQFLTEEMVIPGGAEKQWCFFYTYNGPDAGIDLAQSYQDPDFGHHAQLMATHVSEEDFPDGSVFDCTGVETLNMTDMEPVYIPTTGIEEGYSEMRLEEGMATVLNSGTRLLIQSHYVNYGATPIRVRDGVNLRLVEPESVQTWVTPWVTVFVDLELPPLQETEITFSCTWSDDLGPFEKPVYLINSLGHMHEYGTSFALDHTQAADGVTRSVIDLPEWDAEFRDTPPINYYERDAYRVDPGDVFTVTCRYFNDKDTPIVFPQEMCVATGMAYSTEVDLKVPMICDPS